MKDLKKHLIFIAFILLLFLISKVFSQEQLQNNDANKIVLEQIQTLSFELQNFYHLHAGLVTSIFCISFFIVTILYIPFTGSIYVLFAGALFGFYKGTVLFSFLVSLSYTTSFLISRHILYKFIHKKLGKNGKLLIHGFEKDGVAYLLSIRFAGIIPGVIVNTAMGLTKVTVPQFYTTTQIGTLPHILAMVYAGSQITQIKDMNSLVPENFLIIILCLSILPIIFKIIAQFILKNP